MSNIADLPAFAPHRPGEARQPIYVSGTGSYIKLNGPNEFSGCVMLPPLLAHPGAHLSISNGLAKDFEDLNAALTFVREFACRPLIFRAAVVSR